MRFLFIFLSLTLSLRGCSSLIAVTASGQIEEDYGQRTLGTQIEDNTIEAKARAALKAHHEEFGETNIQFNAFNTVLLITGQVKTQAAKQRISSITQKIRHVRRIHNELEVIGPTAFISRMNDNYLSSKARTRLIFTDGVDSSRINTVVENGTIYLMGLVTQEEAKRSVSALQKVRGLEKIVRVFEYINNQTQ